MFFEFSQGTSEGRNENSRGNSIIRRVECFRRKREHEAHCRSCNSFPEGSGPRQHFATARRQQWEQVKNLTGNFWIFLQFSLSFRIIEVFSWLLEVANDTKEHWDGAKIVWSVSYVHDGPKVKDMSAEVIQPHEEHRKKLVAKLEIQKDDIQSVLPISKVCDLKLSLKTILKVF